MSKVTTEELKLLFNSNANFMHFLRATKELKERNVDISFAFPLFIELALRDNAAVRRIGWNGLRFFFPDKLSGLDASQEELKEADIQLLKETYEEQPD